MQIYRSGEVNSIVHCFAVQNNKLFHDKKRAPAQPENDNFQPISVKTYNPVKVSAENKQSRGRK